MSKQSSLKINGDSVIFFMEELSNHKMCYLARLFKWISEEDHHKYLGVGDHPNLLTYRTHNNVHGICHLIATVK